MKGVETKYLESREEVLTGLAKLNRRQFMKVAGAAQGEKR